MAVMPVVSIRDLARWADAVIALDAPGPLPMRIVLVPSEDHAHALRVALVARAPRALVGTRFFTAAAAARAVLDHAGIAYRTGEEATPAPVAEPVPHRPAAGDLSHGGSAHAGMGRGVRVEHRATRSLSTPARRSRAAGCASGQGPRDDLARARQRCGNVVDRPSDHCGGAPRADGGVRGMAIQCPGARRDPGRGRRGPRTMATSSRAAHVRDR